MAELALFSEKRLTLFGQNNIGLCLHGRDYRILFWYAQVKSAIMESMPRRRASRAGIEKPAVIAEARRMKVAGYSYRQIGLRLGFSCQRAQQILRIPDELRTFKSCQKCGSKEYLQYHHANYATDKFVCLCGSCHMSEHWKHGKVVRPKTLPPLSPKIRGEKQRLIALLRKTEGAISAAAGDADLPLGRFKEKLLLYGIFQSSIDKMKPTTSPTKRKARRLSKWDSLQKEAMSTEFNSNGNNISKTSRTLGISRNAILRKLRRYGLITPQKKQP